MSNIFVIFAVMNNELNLFGEVKEGKLELNNRIALDKWIKTLPEGSKIVMKVRNQDNYYSTRQLRLLYAEFREISKKTGHSVEDVKTMMKMYTGNCYHHTIDGTELTICKSVSDFNRKELSQFIEQIDLWSQKNLDLPLLRYDDIKFLKTTN